MTTENVLITISLIGLYIIGFGIMGFFSKGEPSALPERYRK